MMFTSPLPSISRLYICFFAITLRIHLMTGLLEQLDGSRADYCIRSTLLITELRRAVTSVTCR